jgi:hypothetical protein
MDLVLNGSRIQVLIFNMNKTILIILYLIICAQLGRLVGILVQGQPISIVIITVILMIFIVYFVYYKLFKN